MKHRHEVQVVKRTLNICVARRSNGREKERGRKARRSKKNGRGEWEKKNRNVGEKEGKLFQGYWLITLARYIEARLLACKELQMSCAELIECTGVCRGEPSISGEKVRRPRVTRTYYVFISGASIQVRCLNYEGSRQKPEERSAESGE